MAVPDLSCGMWDLIPRPEIEPRSPALGARNFSHWTTGEVPWICYNLLVHSDKLLLPKVHKIDSVH